MHASSSEWCMDLLHIQSVKEFYQIQGRWFVIYPSKQDWKWVGPAWCDHMHCSAIWKQDQILRCWWMDESDRRPKPCDMPDWLGSLGNHFSCYTAKHSQGAGLPIVMHNAPFIRTNHLLRLFTELVKHDWNKEENVDRFPSHREIPNRRSIR